jgi:hypothetical protein
MHTAAPAAQRAGATEAIQQLRTQAARLLRERNHGDFRTGPCGDRANGARYSQFAQATRSAIRNLVSGNPSLHTRGYTDFNRLLDALDYYTIDRTARDAARQALPAPRQVQFDRWLQRTRDLMQTTFTLLREAALAVNRTYIP